jgi:hypothetical protein
VSAVGVPEITPVLEFKTIPAGSDGLTVNKQDEALEQALEPPMVAVGFIGVMTVFDAR